MFTERANWKDVTPEDATDDELRLVSKIFGPKPDWLDPENWRKNMRACAADLREHIAKQTVTPEPPVTSRLEHGEARRLLVSFLKERGVILKADAPWDVLANAATEALGDWGKGPAVWRDLETGESVVPGDRYLRRNTLNWQTWGTAERGYEVTEDTMPAQRRVLPPQP